MRHLTPIFLFSLPRSGSTLLQRLIAMHPEVTTESETWLLLPLFYLMKNESGVTEYNGKYARAGIGEAFKNIENGKEKYFNEVAKLASNIWANFAIDGEKYFLEKTPRYHLIVEEIIQTFPDAKFIFLWRNPLAITSSIISTWGNNRWNVYRYYIDLYKGLGNLASAFKKHKANSIGLNYETLLEAPEQELNRIMEYLGLSAEGIDPDKLAEVTLTGKMGDKKGTKKYRKISKEPLENWKSHLGNPVRRVWSRKYLDWVGTERLTDMGYDKEDLQNQLSSIPISLKYMVSDIVRIVYGIIFRFFDLSNMWTKIKMIREGRRIYPLF